MNTQWLTATNVLLGLATLLVVSVVAAATIREILWRVEARRLRSRALRRALDLRELGITMQDGGRPVDEEHLPPGG
jgi:hypothetical protein